LLLQNIARYGNFLALRPGEISQIQADADADVLDLVNQYL